ncbi:MAG: pantoate--beta-alanine ligase, partial [Eggerthellaceae bacterium]|nr:pantoate--beta-alanine ligase [Eggerthellaceae bacterium]
MRIIESIQEIRAFVGAARAQDKQIGLVPTMGYLHEGHQSLISKAASENDIVIVSVFVNPTQFGEGEDFESYPRDIEHDSELAKTAGADCIFHPHAEEIYPPQASTFVDMTTHTKELCAITRPTHFRGVCTIISKLFNIIAPDNAYFGKKDAQQLSVIEHMVRDMHFPIRIVGCDIVREEDGLAKSSRNSYLNKQERIAARVLSKAVFAGRSMVEHGQRDIPAILTEMTKIIEAEPLARIDYIQAVDF